MTDKKESTTISAKEVKRVAALSRLQLTDEEIGQASKDLSGVLNHFSLIQNIDTVDVPTADDSTGLVNVTRPDETEEEILATHKQLIELAPDSQEKQIKVKSVFN